MIVLDGASLTPADVAAVAREGVQVALADEGRARNAHARAAIAAHLQRGEPLYGASTGVGALRDRQITDAERENLQWNLLRSHAVTAGMPIPPDVVRAGMVVRANQIAAGGAGVTPELHDALIAAINAGVAPLTPRALRNRWPCSGRRASTTRCGGFITTPARIQSISRIS